MIEKITTNTTRLETVTRLNNPPNLNLSHLSHNNYLNSPFSWENPLKTQLETHLFRRLPSRWLRVNQQERARVYRGIRGAGPRARLRLSPRPRLRSRQGWLERWWWDGRRREVAWRQRGEARQEGGSRPPLGRVTSRGPNQYQRSHSFDAGPWLRERYRPRQYGVVSTTVNDSVRERVDHEPTDDEREEDEEDNCHG